MNAMEQLDLFTHNMLCFVPFLKIKDLLLLMPLQFFELMRHHQPTLLFWTKPPDSSRLPFYIVYIA